MNRMSPEMAARMEERRKEREDLSNRLREKYAPDLPEKVTNMIFNKAWDDGHASGEQEVEYYYDEIATIANAAWNAATSCGGACNEDPCPACPAH